MGTSYSDMEKNEPLNEDSYSEKVDCEMCGGTGFIFDEVCPGCGGLGYRYEVIRPNSKIIVHTTGCIPVIAFIVVTATTIYLAI